MGWQNSTAKFRFVIVMLVIMTVGFGTAVVVYGQMYRWVDGKGQLHFSNSPQDVPAEIRNKNNEYTPDSSSITINPGDTSTIGSSDSHVKDPLNKKTISIPYTAREGYANRVIIDVTFNNQITVPMMVDTGSPGLVISNRLADRLHLFDEQGGRLLVVISGIGGRKIAAKTIVDKLKIGEITEQFVPAHIVSGMSSSHYQGLIGMDVLSGYTVTIDPTRRRLMAELIPTARNLPGGRNRSWWQANFREFSFYRDYWKQQQEQISRSDSPYSKFSSSKKAEMKVFIQQQYHKAVELYEKLDRYARQHSVPRHWRR